MSLPLTDNAIQASKKLQVTPNMLLKIEGYSQLFGSAQIYKYIKIGDPDLFIGDDWTIGGFSLLDNQSPYFSFNSGATTKITQKLDPSRAQGSSVSSMVISLVDKNEAVSQLVSPGVILPELLGRRATVYLGFSDTAWPQDYNVIFQGTFVSLEPGAGTINLVLSNAEEKKRVPIFNRRTAKLTANVNFRSATFQDIFYQNREDVTNLVTVTYTGGGTAGSEVVSAAGTNITVQIQSGVSTAAQIRKAVEASGLSNQLVTAKITGDSTIAQVTGNVTLSADTVASVDDTSDFSTPVPAEGFRTYLKIENELIEYTGKTLTSFTGLTRGQLYSSGALHKVDTDVESIFRIEGNMLELALKLMLSGGPTYYVENLDIASIGLYDPLIEVPNALFFNEDVIQEYGLHVGSEANVTGAGYSNNVTASIVVEVGVTDQGSYVVLSDTLTNEGSTPGVVKFRSNWNVWPIGMSMLPKEVDVAQHLYLRDTFLQVLTLDIYIKDVSSGKDFIEQQLYLPRACFSVPRKGRSSVAYHIGPLPINGVVMLDDETVLNPGSLKPVRSTSEQFANNINFDFDYDPITEKFKRVLNYSNDEAKARVNTEKQIDIKSWGLRTTSSADTIAKQAANKLLRRYAYGAEFIRNVKVQFGAGYQMEIGDIAAVDYAALQLTDYFSGTRAGGVKLMEIQNVIRDNKTGEISVDLVNTTFAFNDRFGVITPSSKAIAGSTPTKNLLEKSWSTKAFQKESFKWRNYLNQTVLVHSPDWTVQGEATLIGFDNNDPQGMILSPALSFTPLAGYIIQPPKYPNSTDPRVQEFYKLRHAFFSPQVEIVSASSQTVFTVAPADVTKFFAKTTTSLGSAVRIHNFDFTQDAPEAEVIDITGNQITISVATGFVINSTHVVDLIGFPDKQPAYRII